MNRWNLENLSLIIPTLLLISLSILVIYSSAPNLALQQGLTALIGFTFFFIISSIDYKFYLNFNTLLYFCIIILLLIVLIIGFETRGSIRWIPLGIFNLQPSEFGKPVLILSLALFWSKNYPSWINILKSLALCLPFLILIFRQPDLGTTLVLLGIWGVILLATNIPALKIGLMFILTVILAPLIWNFLKDYQRERILSFLEPSLDPLGIGYNVIQSMIAVGSGEVFGRGLGRGTQSRLQFLPEFRTDFIFASIGEEFGFLGSILVLILYGILIYKCLQIISQTNDIFGQLIVFGFLGMLFSQIVINIGMNIGILPVAGITLPFLSYGGSSMLATLITLGMVASVSRHRGSLIDTTS